MIIPKRKMFLTCFKYLYGMFFKHVFQQQFQISHLHKIR